MSDLHTASILSPPPFPVGEASATILRSLNLQWGAADSWDVNVPQALVEIDAIPGIRRGERKKRKAEIRQRSKDAKGAKLQILDQVLEKYYPAVEAELLNRPDHDTEMVRAFLASLPNRRAMCAQVREMVQLQFNDPESHVVPTHLFQSLIRAGRQGVRVVATPSKKG